MLAFFLMIKGKYLCWDKTRYHSSECTSFLKLCIIDYWLIIDIFQYAKL